MAALPVLLCVAFVILVSRVPVSCASDDDQCPAPGTCSCLGPMVDCSEAGLTRVPPDMARIASTWMTILDLRSNKFEHLVGSDFKGLGRLQELELGNNKLDAINQTVFDHLPNLAHLRLYYNNLKEIPNIGRPVNITHLILHHNKISSISRDALVHLPKLRVLDLNYNKIKLLVASSFPPMPNLHHLFMNSNRLQRLELGSLDHLAGLEWLKLNKNRLQALPKDLFRNLSSLRQLELNRNQLRSIPSLQFTGLSKLEALKLRKNGLEELHDGAFWGLDDLHNLQLDFNKIVEVKRGWLYGLSNLQQLSLSNNLITGIDPRGWEFCPALQILDLRHNQLTQIRKDTFAHLTSLRNLYLDNNRVSYISDGAFRQLINLQILDMNHNDISWSINDMDNAFVGLTRLNRLGLNSNSIRSIAKRAFHGLDQLKHLELINNQITSVQSNAFAEMTVLQELKFNSSNLICDCQLSWLPKWLKDTGFKNSVYAKCAHPEWLKGKDIFEVPYEDFRCDDVPHPVMIVEPDSHVALKGTNTSLTCTAASSGSKMSAVWKKGSQILEDATVNTFSTAGEGKLVKLTTVLHLINVSNADEGDYQCLIHNKLGSKASHKAHISVHVMPYFTVTPEPLVIKAGSDAKLECAARGQPEPEIAWQKDGGQDFPAARERRMRMHPGNAVYFITGVKSSDEGVYSCTASSIAGTITFNTTLRVLEEPKFVRAMKSEVKAVGDTTVFECITSGSPKPSTRWLKNGQEFEITPRHFLAAERQLLIIMRTELADAGTYTCEVTNALGTQSESAELQVKSQGPTSGAKREVQSGGLGDQSTTTGIIIIAVVCCVVGTSLVWVIIIYQTRKKNDEYTNTPTDETTLPGDMVQQYAPDGRVSPGGHSNSIGYPSIYGMYRQRPAAIFPSDVHDDDHRQSVPLTMDEQPVPEASDNSLNALHRLRCSTASDTSGGSPSSGTLVTFQPGPHVPGVGHCHPPQPASAIVHAVPTRGSTSPQYLHTLEQRLPSEQHGTQPPGHSSCEPSHKSSATFPRSHWGSNSPAPHRTRSEHSSLNQADSPLHLHPVNIHVNPHHHDNHHHHSHPHHHHKSHPHHHPQQAVSHPHTPASHGAHVHEQYVNLSSVPHQAGDCTDAATQWPAAAPGGKADAATGPAASGHVSYAGPDLGTATDHRLDSSDEDSSSPISHTTRRQAQDRTAEC